MSLHRSALPLLLCAGLLLACNDAPKRKPLAVGGESEVLVVIPAKDEAATIARVVADVRADSSGATSSETRVSEGGAAGGSGEASGQGTAPWGADPWGAWGGSDSGWAAATLTGEIG